MRARRARAPRQEVSTIGAWFLPFTSGLLEAMFLFLLAAGLSLIFGISRVLNLAHGSIYMVAAYVMYTVMHLLRPASTGSFVVSVLLASLAAMLVGGIIEVLVLRPVYRVGELYVALVTFALILIIQSGVQFFWGTQQLSVPLPRALAGATRILGTPVPDYNLVLLAAGVGVGVGLWWLVHRTRWGLFLRAAAKDREMLTALGLDVGRLFTGTFLLGSALAGLAGALSAPLLSLDPTLGATIVVEIFAVVVIGGLGSLIGSLVAALVVGELESFGILVWAGISLPLIFLVMAVVLIVRPRGLFGQEEG